MHPEELCRMIQCNEDNATEDIVCEREMTSDEYLDKYFNTKQFSVRKFLRLAEEERRQRKESKRLYYYGGK
ncbi:MAG: hypothetical protein IJB74_06075 [Clostridia bacterium]|nr:hypothetical protein [Clostridia bacterium]